MDSVTPYFFTDPLMQQHGIEHPLADAHKQRIVADLRAKAPLFVFVGERPFPELQRLLQQSYVLASESERSRETVNRGVYLRRDAK
jgi:hypothetical protein